MKPPLKMVLLSYFFILGLTLVKITDARQISENALDNEVDCEYGPWGDFDKCTETCGGGSKTRWRDILIEAQFGGKECLERNYDMWKCNTEECPLPAIATIDEITALLDRKLKPIQDSVVQLQKQVSNLMYEQAQDQDEDHAGNLEQQVENEDGIEISEMNLENEGTDSNKSMNDSAGPRGHYHETGTMYLDGGYWGTWGSTHKCTYPAFAEGMELKFEDHHSRDGSDRQDGRSFDDTALNDIRITCSDGQIISSTRPGGKTTWGTWKGYTRCSGKNYITRATIRKESKQGSGDDTAANGIRYQCSDDKEHYPFDGLWGSWQGYQSCPEGSAVMGIQIQWEPHQRDDTVRSFDDTALNDVRLYCASMTD